MGQRERRVVVVARYFPPSGGAPAIRLTKLVKYLPEFGWRPTVVTVPRDHVWEEDETLSAEIPPFVDVHRVPRLFAHTVRPADLAAQAAVNLRPGRAQRLGGALLIPDRSILWAIPAARRVRALMSKADALLTSGPPFSTHLIGLVAGGKPWLADYRDNWTSNPEFKRSGPAGFLNEALERAVLRRASAITAVSEHAAVELGEIEPSALARTIVAMNGFDEEDLPPARPPDREHFRIVYVGSMRPSRDPAAFVAALRSAMDQNRALAHAVELHLIGSIPDAYVGLAREQLGDNRVHVHGFLPHRRALELAADASVLLAISSVAEAGEAALTSKLFEYLALQRPILYLAPPGPGFNLVRDLAAGEAVAGTDLAAVLLAIERLFEAWQRGDEGVADPGQLRRYSRRRTAELVGLALDAAARGITARRSGT